MNFIGENMINKKNIIAISLVLIFLLAGCASKEESKKSEEKISKTTTQVESESSTSLSQDVSETKEDSGSEEETDLGFEDMSGGNNAGQLIKLDDVLVYEDDSLEVRLKDLDLSFYPAYDVGASVKVSVKNKSEDTIVTLARKIAFNDFYLPTSYDALVVTAGESVDGIITLASAHMLEEIISLGEIKKIDFKIASYSDESEYKSSSDTYTYSMDGTYSEPSVPKGEPVSGIDNMNLELSLLSEKIYDDGDNYLIPIYYMNSGEERVLSPSEILINSTEKEQVLGFQTMKKNTQGVMEVILDKKCLEGKEGAEIELKMDVLKANGNKLGVVTSKFFCADNIGFLLSK